MLQVCIPRSIRKMHSFTQLMQLSLPGSQLELMTHYQALHCLSNISQILFHKNSNINLPFITAVLAESREDTAAFNIIKGCNIQWTKVLLDGSTKQNVHTGRGILAFHPTRTILSDAKLHVSGNS